MTDEPSALQRHLQRRRVLDYEAAMARASYAYGVDVRRMQWLLQSTVAGTFVRDIDRRWPKLADTLEREGVRPVDERAPLWLFEEIARLVALLRSTMPSVRVVADRAAASASWGAATPLGAATGDVQWLVVDPVRLAKLAPSERTAALALALGHLHAQHAVWFTAFRLAARRDGVAAAALPGLSLLARPWTRVMSFTADRAALLCVGSLAETRAALAVLADADAKPARAWLPPAPALPERRVALDEFDRTAVVARIRAAQARAKDTAEDTRRTSGVAPSVSSAGTADAGAPNAGAPNAGAPPRAPDPASAPTASASASGGDAPSASTSRQMVPDDAWSLARVDRKLTERLGLP
jgi:hypothetical protein